MKLTNSETARICRGLSLLLHAGIPLSDGVYLLAQEESCRELLEQLGAEMDRGLPLSQAMEDTEAFPSHVLGLTAIGEQTGRMEQILSSLADFYDRRERTGRMLRSAFIYPCIIFCLMLVIIGVLLTQVLPVFDRVYVSLGSGLTGLAGGLLRLGQWLEGAFPVLAAVLGVLLIAGFLITRQKKLRHMLLTWLRSRFGDWWILKKFNNAQFAQAMTLALGSGMGLEQALDLAAALLSDIPQAVRRCDQCRKALAQEQTLAQAMLGAQLLTAAQSRLLAVGLRSGTADQVMADIADRLEEDAQEALEGAVARVEPILVLSCSCLVGLIILAVMLPLAGLLSAMG